MLLSSCLCPTQRQVSRKARSLFLSVHNLKTKSIAPSTASLTRPISHSHSDAKKYPISHWTTQCTQLHRELSTWAPTASIATRSATPLLDEDKHDDDILEKLDNPIDIVSLIENAEASKKASERGEQVTSPLEPRCSIEDLELLIKQHKVVEALQALCTAPQFTYYPANVRQKVYEMIGVLDTADIIDLLKDYTHHRSKITRVWRVIKEAIETWDREKVVEIIRDCSGTDERLQIHLFSKLVQDYRGAPDMPALLNAIPRNDPLAVKLFNMALSVAMRQRKSDDVDLILYEMQERKVDFDVVSYNILIRSKLIQGKEALAGAGLMYDQMIKQGIQPSTATFNLFIDYSCRYCAWDEMDMWMDRMKELKVEGNNVTLRILLSASQQHTDIPLVGSAFEKIVSTVPVQANEETLIPIIAILLRHKQAKTALALLEKIFSKDYMPSNPTAYNLLIHGLSQKGDLEAAHDVLRKMASGRDERIPLPDIISYTTLMHGYIRRAESQDIDIDVVLQLYQQLRIDGFHVNPTLQAVLLYGIIKSRHVGIHKARALFDMIIAQDDKLEGVPNNQRLSQAIVYNLMMDGYFVHQYHRKKRFGISATSLDAPKELLEDAIRKKLDLSTSSLNIWVRGLANFNKDLAAARAIIKQFGRMGIEPNERTMWYLCASACQIGQRGIARRLLHEYISQGHVIRGRGLNELKKRLRI